MTLRDKFYFRFGLFHKTHLARFIAAFVEGLLLGFCLLVVVLAVMAFGRIAWWAWDELHTAQQKVVNAEKVAMYYQTALINCLNGGLIAVTDKEIIGCEGARSIKR